MSVPERLELDGEHGGELEVVICGPVERGAQIVALCECDLELKRLVVVLAQMRRLNDVEHSIRVSTPELVVTGFREALASEFLDGLEHPESLLFKRPSALPDEALVEQ